jgi:hypothetical protein
MASFTVEGRVCSHSAVAGIRVAVGILMSITAKGMLDLRFVKCACDPLLSSANGCCEIHMIHLKGSHFDATRQLRVGVDYCFCQSHCIAAERGCFETHMSLAVATDIIKGILVAVEDPPTFVDLRQRLEPSSRKVLFEKSSLDQLNPSSSVHITQQNPMPKFFFLSCGELDIWTGAKVRMRALGIVLALRSLHSKLIPCTGDETGKPMTSLPASKLLTLA